MSDCKWDARASKFARFPPKTGSRRQFSKRRIPARRACHRLSPPMSPVSNTSARRAAPSGSGFWCKKRLKRSSPKSPFFVSDCKWMPEPPNSQVFRKRAPDVSFPLSARKSGEFQPAEHVTACHRFVTACHRFVTALFGAEKCAKGLEKRNQLRGFGPTSLWRGPGAGLVRLGAVLARAQPCDGAGPAVELPGLRHVVDAHQEGQTACEERVSEL